MTMIVDRGPTNDKVLWPFNEWLCEVKWQIKALKLIYHNTYCHQSCQGGDLLREAPTLKVTLPFNHDVLWFWFYLIRFVGLEHKSLSPHHLFVSFGLSSEASGCIIGEILEKKNLYYGDNRHSLNLRHIWKQGEEKPELQGCQIFIEFTSYMV